MIVLDCGRNICSTRLEKKNLGSGLFIKLNFSNWM